MVSSISNSKSELRTQIRDRLKNISLAVRTVESMELCARLEPQLRSAQTILFYAPLPDELDVWPLMEKLLQSKICALPAFDVVSQTYLARRVKNLKTDIVTGKFGVAEPLPDCEQIALNQFHLALVPGLAFDSRGNRLGRGKGFYDRILSEVRGVKCGVSYDFQFLEKIAVEPHDVRMDFIFTPMRGVRRES